MKKFSLTKIELLEMMTHSLQERKKIEKKDEREI